MASKLVFATRSCTTYGAGPRRPNVVVTRGEAWHASDPFVALHPDLFADEPPEIRGVEAATRAPGEKRKTTRRA